MNKEFVPYNEALELKKLGFDEPCFGYYEPNGDFNYIESNILKNFPYLAKNSEWKDLCGAPTYSQAFKFFRERQNWSIDSWVRPYLSEQPKQYEGFYWIRGKKVSVGVFSTHGDAELACLRKLIEIVKNK